MKLNAFSFLLVHSPQNTHTRQLLALSLSLCLSVCLSVSLSTQDIVVSASHTTPSLPPALLLYISADVAHELPLDVKCAEYLPLGNEVCLCVRDRLFVLFVFPNTSSFPLRALQGPSRVFSICIHLCLFVFVFVRKLFNSRPSPSSVPPHRKLYTPAT